MNKAAAILAAFFLLLTHEVRPGEKLIDITPPDSCACLYSARPELLKEQLDFIFRDSRNGALGDYQPQRFFLSVKEYLPLSYDELESLNAKEIAVAVFNPGFEDSQERSFALYLKDPDASAARDLIFSLDRRFPKNAKISRWDRAGELIRVVDYLVNVDEKKKRKKFAEKDGEDIDDAGAIPVNLGLKRQLRLHAEYAFVNGVFIVSRGKVGAVENARNRLESGSAPSLTKIELYQKVLPVTFPDESLRVFVNLRKTASFLEKGGDPDKMRYLKGLGLDGLEALGLRFGENGGRLILENRLAAAAERRGLASALFRFQPGDFDELPFIPGDALSVSVNRVNFNGLWSDLKEAADGAYPRAASSLRLTLRANTPAFGFDIERDVIGAVDGEFGYYALSPEGGSEPAMVYFARLRESGKFRVTLENIFQFTERFFLIGARRTEFDGSPYWIPRERVPSADPGDDALWAAAVLGDYFFFSSSEDLLQRVIRRKKMGEGKSGARRAVPEDERLCGFAIFNDRARGFLMGRLAPHIARSDGSETRELRSLIRREEENAPGEPAVNAGPRKSVILREGDVITFKTEFQYP